MTEQGDISPCLILYETRNLGAVKYKLSRFIIFTGLGCFRLVTGLLIFRAIAEPRNSGKSAKFTKTQKMPRNSVEILSNTCLYNIFETYFSYWGYLIAVNLQIYLRTSSLKRANNVPRLPRVDYVAKNWALAMMLKALPLVHFWRALLLKTLKTIAQFALEISTKSAVFYRLLFGEFCPGKFPRNSREIGRFFRELVPKNPAKFDFFFRDLSEALFGGYRQEPKPILRYVLDECLNV